MISNLLQNPGGVLLWGEDTWLPGCEALLLHDPARVLSTDDPELVSGLLDEAEAEIRRGHYVAGYLSYEAGRAFDLSTHQPNGQTPLVWLGCYPASNVLAVRQDKLRLIDDAVSIGNSDVSLNVTVDDFNAAIARIKELIASGDTYQVNYTCHARFSAEVDPLGYFLALARSHPVPYAAYLNLGEAQILSLSPEMFLQKRGDILDTRPMKGTRRRGRTLEEDVDLARELVESQKDRAENVMILDMMRSDLGRICRYGTVHVPEMFATEKYRSVWQMTSAATGVLREGVSFREIMAATFPGSSITGAPKRRTMEIIRDLEREPRGVYTGTIGIFAPGGDFTCNIAIRTLVHKGGEFDLGIGSGIVWDSDPQSEYEETLLKSSFAFSLIPDLRLFETMLLTESGVYLYENEHIERLAKSAEYWDFPFEKACARVAPRKFVRSCGVLPLVVRMELDEKGKLRLNSRPIAAAPAEPVRILLSSRRTDSRDRLLFHKTTERKLYNEAREQAVEQGFYEVIFQNEKGNLTEGSITNIFVRIGDEWITPPIGDGLLPGVWRADYLRETGGVERSISVEELSAADEIIIGNSVRGAISVGEVSDGKSCQLSAAG
ncbi:MAG: aminodeoxychorismate synthase component I [Armatimonadota bacterium]|nr:aminodeoxychorismate synthase component I [Armatimonadota bacterium]